MSQKRKITRLCGFRFCFLLVNLRQIDGRCPWDANVFFPGRVPRVYYGDSAHDRSVASTLSNLERLDAVSTKKKRRQGV